jgi:hypothetical protein
MAEIAQGDRAPILSSEWGYSRILISGFIFEKGLHDFVPCIIPVYQTAIVFEHAVDDFVRQPEPHPCFPDSSFFHRMEAGGGFFHSGIEFVEHRHEVIDSFFLLVTGHKYDGLE